MDGAAFDGGKVRTAVASAVRMSMGEVRRVQPEAVDSVFRTRSLSPARHKNPIGRPPPVLPEGWTFHWAKLHSEPCELVDSARGDRDGPQLPDPGTIGISECPEGKGGS